VAGVICGDGTAQHLSKGKQSMHKCLVSAAFLATLLTGMSFGQAPKAEKSLYERLGGQPAVEAVASGLVDRILADNRINKWFTHASSSPENTKAYKEKLTAFICTAVGGPCKYTGRDMVAAHKGRGVTSDAFNAVADDLSKQLDQLKVPAKEKKEVMDLVGSLKPSIVQEAAVTK
jgi:hemoglobin